MEKQVFTGKTKEEAIKAGLEALGKTEEEVEIVVLEEGKKKLFGSIPASVEITVKEVVETPVEEKKTKKKAKKNTDGLTDGERAVKFLEGLFPLLGAEVTCELKKEEEKIEISLLTENTGSVIGRRGETIDAIQTLAGAIANTGRDNYKRVVVDCGNYRDEREATLQKVAKKLADKAVRLGKKVRLEPMNPYERRIIHATLVDNPDVTTKSEGKEPGRFVVIIPNNLKSFDRRNSKGGRNGRNGGYNRDKKYGERKPYPKRELPTENTPDTMGTSFRREETTVPGYKKGGFNGFFGTFLGNSGAGDDKNED